MTDQIKEMLDRLDEFEAVREKLFIEEKEKIDELIGPETLKKIEAVEAEYKTMTIAAGSNIFELRSQISDQVKSLGETVKASHYMAVYSKPRETWDGKGLAGFAVAHPEIEAFRKVGSPTVSIRAIKKD